MLPSVLLALFLSVVPATAFANERPSIMAAIDAALPTATLAEPDMTKVTELRTKGEELHAAGDHAGSIAVLNQAKKMLGIQALHRARRTHCFPGLPTGTRSSDDFPIGDLRPKAAYALCLRDGTT